MKIRVVCNTWEVTDGWDTHKGRIIEPKDSREIEIYWGTEHPENKEEIENLIRSKL